MKYFVNIKNNYYKYYVGPDCIKHLWRTSYSITVSAHPVDVGEHIHGTRLHEVVVDVPHHHCEGTGAATHGVAGVTDHDGN